MAEMIASLNKSSRVRRELLNTPLALTTSAQTFTLSHPITDYDFIIFYTRQDNSNPVSILGDTRLYNSLNLVTSDYLKTNNNNLQQYVYKGSEGKTRSVTISIAYVNDTQIRVSLSEERIGTYFFVYGIKSELGGTPR